MLPNGILRTRTVGILLALIISTLFALPQPAKAGDSCWFTGGDSGWEGSSNWSCGHAPGPDDTALIDHNQNEALQTVRVASDVTVGALSLAGNIMCAIGPGGNPVCGNLTVLGNLDWREGTIDGDATTTVAAGATGTISGPNDKWLTHSHRLTNYGTLTWTGGNIIGNYDIPEINNMAGALFDAHGDNNLIFNSGSSFNFNNYGTFRKSAGTGQTNLECGGFIFNNGGTIDAQTGTIDIPYCGLGSATLNLQDGSVLTGAGVTRVEWGVTNTSGAIASENLEFHNGTLHGTGTIHGTWSWTGGTMDNAGTTTNAADGTLNISGPDEKRISHGHVLTNNGSVNWTEGDINGYYDVPVINNQAGALFNAQSDNVLRHWGGSTITLNNAGTFRKSAGTGETLLGGGVVLNSSGGTIDAQTGTIHVNGSTGNFDDGSHFTGAGVTRLDNGTWIFSGTSTSQNLELAGGTLNGTGTIGGTWNWTGGTLDGAGTTTNETGATLNISGGGERQISHSHILQNRGTVNWIGANITGYYGTPGISNEAGAVFDAKFDGGLGGWGVTLTFNNAGILRKSGGTGETRLGGGFTLNNNGGTIDAQTGTIHIYGEAGNFSDGSSFTGAGVTRLENGTWTLNGNINTQNLEVASGAMQGTHTIQGTLNWTGGEMSGDGTTTIAAGATVRINGAAKWIKGRTVTNSGIVDWTDNSIQCRDGVVINNQAGAVWQTNLPSYGAWLSHWTGTQSVFNNAGTFKNMGTGTVWTSVAFTNSGTVDAQSGSMEFHGPPYIQTAGATRLSGGAIAFPDQAASIQGGKLEGNGTITGNVNNSGGTVAPGLSPGILTVTGSSRGVYTQGSGASLNIEIGGTTVGSEFDQLNADGKAELDGALNLSTIGGYSPNVGDSFQIMTFGWHSGNFATTTGTDLGCGKYFQVNYGGSDITLLVQGPPAPTLATLSRNSAVAGEAGFTLTVTGSDFNTCSKVRWNAADRTTTFVSSTQLDAAITSGDLVHAGSVNVTVYTPIGGTSDPQTFSIDKADTTMWIVSHTPDPSVIGQTVAVTFALAVNSPGGGSPTGTVTVGDGTVSCNATLPAASCQLTFTTAGTKTLTATYAGDGDYKVSASPGVTHTVNAVADDDFDQATQISSMPYSANQNTTQATTASDDPVFACFAGKGSASLWFRFSPATNGLLKANTTGSNYDTVLAVWRGSRGSLISVACNDNNGTAKTSAVNASLIAGTAYYVEVVGRTTGGTLKLAATFTSQAPAAPKLLSPANGSHSYLPSAVLDWSDSPGATFYRVEVHKGSASGKVADSAQPTDSTYTTKPLLAGLYSWRAAACNSIGCKWSGSWKLTVVAPARPTLLSPANGSTTGGAVVTLDWSDSSGASYYQVQVRQDTKSGSLVVDQQPSASTFITPSLLSGHWYYWRVRPCSSAGCSAWSAWWKFKIP